MLRVVSLMKVNILMEIIGKEEHFGRKTLIDKELCELTPKPYLAIVPGFTQYSSKISHQKGKNRRNKLIISSIVRPIEVIDPFITIFNHTQEEEIKTREDWFCKNQNIRLMLDSQLVFSYESESKIVFDQEYGTDFTDNEIFECF